MTSLVSSIIFRLKLAQVILSFGSIIPVFAELDIAFSRFSSDFAYLTLYSYLGIGIITLVSLCIAEPISEKLALYSSGLAVIMHLISAVFIIIDVFGHEYLWALRLISGLCAGANSVAYGWEVLYTTKFVHHWGRDDGLLRRKNRKKETTIARKIYILMIGIFFCPLL